MASLLFEIENVLLCELFKIGIENKWWKNLLIKNGVVPVVFSTVACIFWYLWPTQSESAKSEQIVRVEAVHYRIV